MKSINMKRVLVRAVISYLFLSGFFFLACPATLPRLAARCLGGAGGPAAGEVAVRTVAVDGPTLRVEITSHRLSRFEKGGEPLPAFRFGAALQAGVVNVYPVVVFTLLLAWPFFPSARSRLLAVLLAGVLTLAAAVLDVHIQAWWAHAEALGKAFSQAAVPATAKNLAALQALQREAARLTAAKSFLSAGGRHFLAILVFLLAVAPSWLRRPLHTPEGQVIR